MSEVHLNMFAGSHLNRLSWLRPSHIFLNIVVSSSKTRWLLFKSGQPLTFASDGQKALAYLTTDDVKPFLGGSPYFGQGKVRGELLSESEENSFTEAVRHDGPPVVFLGLKEPESITVVLPSSEFKDPTAAASNIEGTPYFSMDLAEVDLPDDDIQKVLDGTELGRTSTLTWAEPRTLMRGLDPFHGSVFAEARSLVDWNLRNKFCPACGSAAYSMWGGWKIACSTLLPWSDNTGRKPCITARGLHNFTHPRTDPVVIMLAIDPGQDRILLGRNAKFPGNFYSALAGFIEPGETFEEAVAREMWEEAGVKVSNVRYHSGQPWPYPANLMVGFYAKGDASQKVRIDLDNELADARWYSRSEVLTVLNHPDGTNFTSRDYKKLNDLIDGIKSSGPDDAPVAKQDGPPFRVPPTTAIAGVLIRDWAEGKIKFASSGDKGALSNL